MPEEPKPVMRKYAEITSNPFSENHNKNLPDSNFTIARAKYGTTADWRNAATNTKINN